MRQKETEVAPQVQITRRFTAAVLGLGIALSGACTEPPVAPRANVAVATTNQDFSAALTSGYSQEYSWTQGQPATLMGTTAYRACFITRITGRFAGGGESVRIYKSNGSWYLSGASQQQDVSASARCYAQVYEGPAEFQARSTNGLVQTSLYTPPYVCGLTGIQGKFQSWGDFVRIIRPATSSSTWTLRVAVNPIIGQPTVVSAWARCFYPVSLYSQEFNWQGTYTPAVQLWSASRSFCWLTMMQGNFDGAGEYLWVRPSAIDWWLLGRSQQTSIRGTAHCLTRYTFGTS
jgi:hypothetical protein